MAPDGHTNPEQEKAADARLWGHVLHEEILLFQRGNLFLIAQSLLAVAYSTIAKPDGMNTPARVMAAFGIALTLTWLFVGHRHLKFCTAIQQRVIDRFPDVAETEAACREPGLRTWPFMVYGLPILASVMWIMLLVIT
ncbi:hypothetical protein [Streptomyces sp. NBC_01465]|uniref:hypothetical protein n=1 Tax=Streptomyces sp. NBC_01465 TaxID=2903878 RepID=UPI002E32B3BD|nr:hypothetical protein [Streptomyces sp. NBC_01465]